MLFLSRSRDGLVFISSALSFINHADYLCYRNACLSGGPNISGDVLRQILGKRIAITGTTLRTRTVEVS